MKKSKKILSLFILLSLALGLLCGCSAQDVVDIAETAVDIIEILEESEESEAPQGKAPEAEQEEAAQETPDDTAPALDPDGSYDSMEDVALYIHTYGCLPKNFVTKSEARDAGWSGGSVERYLPGMCIGGDYFGNKEGLLPDAKGRTWTECDINTLGADSRGAERIIFSNDGLIYYTNDHYESFSLLYGEP